GVVWWNIPNSWLVLDEAAWAAWVTTGSPCGSGRGCLPRVERPDSPVPRLMGRPRTADAAAPRRRGAAALRCRRRGVAVGRSGIPLPAAAAFRPLAGYQRDMCRGVGS